MSERKLFGLGEQDLVFSHPKGELFRQVVEQTFNWREAILVKTAVATLGTLLRPIPSNRPAARLASSFATVASHALAHGC